MRIAFLVHQYPPHEVGGTELLTQGLAERARRDGHQVLVICTAQTTEQDPAAWATFEEEVAGVRVRRLERNHGAAPSIVAWEHDDPEVGARVTRLLATFAPDIVHVVHGLRLGATSIDACRVLGIPFVVTLCDFWFLCPRHTLLTADGRLCDGPTDPDACSACVQDLHDVAPGPTVRAILDQRPERLRACLEGATTLVALSRFQRDVFLCHGYDPGRMTIMPHGIEVRQLEVAPDPGPRARLVCIAHLVAHKGQDVAIEALAARRGLDAELVLIGAPGADGDYVARVEALAASDPRVVLAGPVAPAEIGSVLARADALVLPARWYENDPLVVKAALHVGLPVIASRIGSLAEQVRDGVDGRTLPPGDIEAWASAFEDVVLSRRRVEPRPQTTAEEHYAAMVEIYTAATAA